MLYCSARWHYIVSITIYANRLLNFTVYEQTQNIYHTRTYYGAWIIVTQYATAEKCSNSVACSSSCLRPLHCRFEHPWLHRRHVRLRTLLHLSVVRDRLEGDTLAVPYMPTVGPGDSHVRHRHSGLRRRYDHNDDRYVRGSAILLPRFSLRLPCCKGFGKLKNSRIPT